MFQFEAFADITELKALATLIGPGGMRYFERAILSLTNSHMDIIRECVRVNEPVLKVLVNLN